MANRKAVSVILIRRPEGKEVFLVERSPKLKFFGGYLAFPGGTLDKEDSEIRVRHQDEIETEMVPNIVAAAREIFEETGVLLCTGSEALSNEERRHYRLQLLAEEKTFGEILALGNLCIDSRDFNFIANLLTPEFAPVRYDTQFYWAQVPAGQAPTIIPGELVRGEFREAEEFLAEWRAGECLVVPPAIFMLKEIEKKSLEASIPALAEQAMSYAAGALHEIYFTPGVQMLPLKTQTLLPATHTNAYLVGEHTLYLVDPAPSNPEEQQRLWDYLDKRLAEGRKLSAILLTHHHSDHIGAVTEAQSRYQLPVFAHALTADHLSEIHFERLLQDEDELELGASPDGTAGWKLTALHTPGHASGHLAFQENRYGAVIAGDMISTLSTILINPPDGRLADYMASLKRLHKITTAAIYPGHGPAAQEGRAVLSHFIRHREEREQKLLAALGSGPQSSSNLVKKVYDDVGPALWTLAEMSLHAGLLKLIEEKKCQKKDNAYTAI